MRGDYRTMQTVKRSKRYRCEQMAQEQLADEFGAIAALKSPLFIGIGVDKHLDCTLSHQNLPGNKVYITGSRHGLRQFGQNFGYCSGDRSGSRGRRIAKDSLSVATYGTVDEANVMLGAALSLMITSPEFFDLIRYGTRIQRDLFDVGRDLATPDDKRGGVHGRRTLHFDNMAGTLVAENHFYLAEDREESCGYDGL